MKTKAKMETHTAQDDNHNQGQHGAVKAGTSRAAPTEEGHVDIVCKAILVIIPASFQTPQVSMETWRTLSSTWLGAGRNPTTQISA